MEPLAALARAGEGYRQHLAAVSADQWARPSVCDGWTVQDLADHVLGGNRFAVGLLAGQTAEEAFGHALELGFDGDPVALLDESAVAQIEAFGAPGALERLVQHPAGEIDGLQFLGFRLGDLVLHGWDLARSTGGDDRLDDELVPAVWEAYQPAIGAAADRGVFGDGASGDVGPDAPLALRLLDLTGRRP